MKRNQNYLFKELNEILKLVSTCDKKTIERANDILRQVYSDVNKSYIDTNFLKKVLFIYLQGYAPENYLIYNLEFLLFACENFKNKPKRNLAYLMNMYELCQFTYENPTSEQFYKFLKYEESKQKTISKNS